MKIVVELILSLVKLELEGWNTMFDMQDEVWSADLSGFVRQRHFHLRRRILHSSSSISTNRYPPRLHITQHWRALNQRSSITKLLEMHRLYPRLIVYQWRYCSSDEGEFYPAWLSWNLWYGVSRRRLHCAMVRHRANRCSPVQFAVIIIEDADRTHPPCAGDVLREMLLILEMVQTDISSDFAMMADLFAPLNLTNETKSMLWKTQIHTRLNM